MPTYSSIVLATPNLAAYWRLGETSGTTANDASGNARNLTYTGSPSLNQTGMLTGDPDKSVDFNGSTQYAIGGGASNTGLQGGSALTLEAWMVGDSTGNKCPAGLFGSGTQKGYWFNFASNIGMWVSPDGSAQTLCQSPDATVTGQIYHVVGTYDGSNIRLYVNGVLKQTQALAGTIWTVATSNAFAIGRLGALSSDYFDGRVDEVAVYNRALTLSEIQNHYTAGTTTPSTGLSYRAQGPTDAVIALAGWGDQRLIPITPPTMSWRTDGPGSFQATIDSRTLHKHGLAVIGATNPLKGRWLWWEHPTAGAWGGVITATDVGKWQTQITAEQFAVLLRKRRTNSNYGAMSMSPGSLALMFMTSAERNGDTLMLTSWTAEECGTALNMQPRGGDLCDDILSQLASYGYQWRIKATTMTERAFEFRTRLGTDKRGSVMLSDGRHLVDVSSAGDLWTVANSILGVAGDSDFTSATGYQLDDDRSIRTLRRRFEATIPYTGVVTRSTIVPLVKQDLKALAYPKEVYTADIVDEDSIWATYREGDIVSIASASLNYQGPMDVDIRSLDMRQQVMTIAGKLRYREAA